MSPRVGSAALVVTGLLRPCWCQLATCFVWVSVGSEWTPAARKRGTGQESAPHLLAAFTTLGNLAQLTGKGLGEARHEGEVVGEAAGRHNSARIQRQLVFKASCNSLIHPLPWLNFGIIRLTQEQE